VGIIDTNKARDNNEAHAIRDLSKYRWLSESILVRFFGTE